MKRSLLITMIICTGALAISAGLAQSGTHGGNFVSAGMFDLTWHTIDGGGGTSTGGGFEVSGTIGQPDAGSMSGGDYSLAGGFWAGTGGVEPKTPSCPGDLNGDGVVDVSDLLALLGAWGTCANPSNCPADLNGDGVVDVSDLLMLLGAWGSCR